MERCAWARRSGTKSQTEVNARLVSLLKRITTILVNFLPPATKLGQGNIFRSVFQEFCSREEGVSQHVLQVSRPAPREEVEGSGQGDLQANTQGEVEGSGQVGVSRPRGEVEGSGQEGLQAHTQGGSPAQHPGGSPGPYLGGGVSRPPPRGVSRPTPRRVCVSQHALTQSPSSPPADGYCCGRYASYWNAFLHSTDLWVPLEARSHGRWCLPTANSSQSMWTGLSGLYATVT